VKLLRSACGHWAGRRLALGALALGGAAVALAGCASVPTSKTGAASHPPASTPPGTGLTGGQSTRLTPKQRATADADATFAAFAVPPGARELSRAPSADGGALERAAELSDTPDLMDKAGWWLVPGAPGQVLAWEAGHLPRRFSAEGSGSSGAPGPEAESFEVFSLPAVTGVLDSRGLLVQAVADGKQTAVTGRPPRTVEDFLHENRETFR
jgi:hypothetical protein